MPKPEMLLQFDYRYCTRVDESQALRLASIKNDLTRRGLFVEVLIDTDYYQPVRPAEADDIRNRGIKVYIKDYAKSIRVNRQVFQAAGNWAGYQEALEYLDSLLAQYGAVFASTAIVTRTNYDIPLV